MVVPFGADDGGSWFACDCLVVDVTVLKVATVPVVLNRDSVKALYVENEDSVTHSRVDLVRLFPQPFSERHRYTIPLRVGSLFGR